MKTDQVLETYDAEYAAEYNPTFLQDDQWATNSLNFLLEILGKLLENAGNWVDVACGTGFILSQFPKMERAGLDLSPAMIEVARRNNPGVDIREANYREDIPEWEGKWDVVSCMWWAYCLAESMSEVRALIANLARWASDRGTCFIPLCNPQKFDTQNTKIPYVDPKVPGRCMITGITWTWIQENGKRHDEVVSPQVEHLVMIFRQHFDEVEIIEGPIDLIGEGWRVQDILVARRKRSQPVDHRKLIDFAEEIDPRASHWQLGTVEGNVAGLSFPLDRKDIVGVTIEAARGDSPWNIQLSCGHIKVRKGARYLVFFRGPRAARTDGQRCLFERCRTVGRDGALFNVAVHQ